MLFNSYIFILAFLPTAVLGYFGLHKAKKHKLAKIFLCIMSLIFYGYFKIWYVFIIISSIIVNYFGTKLMSKIKGKTTKTIYFITLLIINIGVLVYFKYLDFILLNLNILFKTSFDAMNVLLPLGISFFTFQQLSYVIDCYKNKETIKYKFWDYTLFVTFFPQLIADR